MDGRVVVRQSMGEAKEKKIQANLYVDGRHVLLWVLVGALYLPVSVAPGLFFTQSFYIS